MPRTNNTKLPDKSELNRILETEVDFPVPAEKQTAHYATFETIVALCAALSVDDTIFTNDRLTIHQVVETGRQTVGSLVEKAMVADPTPLAPLHTAAYDYLSEEDAPTLSDLIFVFGAKTPLRAQKAAELYQQGLAPQVLISGGAPIYARGNEEPEAAHYRDILLEHGVPESAITLETLSVTMADNVRRSLSQFEDQGYRPRSIILVNSPYSQRRGWAHFNKHLPDGVTLCRVNCGTNTELSRDNWFKQESSLRIVLNEFVKMRASVVYNTA